jgi:hypothetical protein
MDHFPDIGSRIKKERSVLLYFAGNDFIYTRFSIYEVVNMLVKASRPTPVQRLPQPEASLLKHCAYKYK